MLFLELSILCENALIDDSDKSGTPNGWYASVLGGFALGIFFVALGIYGVTTSLQHPSDMLIAGVGGIFLGLQFLWLTLQFVRPSKKPVQNLNCVCPSCGSVIEEDATVCIRGGRKTEQ